MSNQHIPITRQEIQQLGENYARFVYLQNATIKQPKDDAEIAGLVSYLGRFFIDHASEFIGSWFAVRNEYEPLIGLVAAITRRASGLIAHQDAMAKAQPEPENVSPLIVPGK
jgi:hypothetical protein